MTLITSAIKDRVLNYICNSCPLEQYAYHPTAEFLKEVDADFQSLYAILYQFERFGFLSNLGVGRDNICFTVRVEMHDLAQKGGFETLEEIFAANINKLLLEVDKLKKDLAPNHLETVNKISSLASAIFSGLSLFK